ncbi:hypothetical protein A3L01_04105 [Thermococcus barossii]|uniref:Uncharacterized protein n=1 Tax=Thermococcus barossii TaxID=54077 RepID=A0A2Z2MQN3_9EURY|nr:hypothetical protein A3L01_04105 [Thermococcus barossii]
MRANNVWLLEAYKRNYSASLTSFFKRLSGYLAASLVVALYGKAGTAIVVLATLVVIDLVMTLSFARLHGEESRA